MGGICAKECPKGKATSEFVEPDEREVAQRECGPFRQPSNGNTNWQIGSTLVVERHERSGLKTARLMPRLIQGLHKKHQLRSQTRKSGVDLAEPHRCWTRVDFGVKASPQNTALEPVPVGTAQSQHNCCPKIDILSR